MGSIKAFTESFTDFHSPIFPPDPCNAWFLASLAASMLRAWVSAFRDSGKTKSRRKMFTKAHTDEARNTRVVVCLFRKIRAAISGPKAKPI